MTPFLFERATDNQAAIALGTRAGASYLGGGTNLVDLMRETIARPTLLVDVTGLSDAIADGEGDSLTIGAEAKNTAVAADRRVRARFPLLSQAILAGASAQIRNMATVGGNILQRTRCDYFYDEEARCNKRAPGTGCDAIDGFSRYHAILGASQHCIATHPSDMCVALAALDATVMVEGQQGKRIVPLVDFHHLPGERPDRETVLQPGDLITGITLPAEAASPRAIYRKVRDRTSYAFALVSVAASLEVDRGVIRSARLALGGVAHKPWRAHAAEALLIGNSATAATFAAAADAELAPATAQRDNGFKIDLARRVITDTFDKLSRQPETAR